MWHVPNDISQVVATWSTHNTFSTWTHKNPLDSSAIHIHRQDSETTWGGGGKSLSLFSPHPLLSWKIFEESIIKNCLWVQKKNPGSSSDLMSCDWCQNVFQLIRYPRLLCPLWKWRMSLTSHSSLLLISTCLDYDWFCSTIKSIWCWRRTHKWNTGCTSFMERGSVSFYEEADVCWQIEKGPSHMWCSLLPLLYCHAVPAVQIDLLAYFSLWCVVDAFV